MGAILLIVKLNDLGIIDGLHTWEVIDTSTGEVIGYNQTTPEEPSTSTD
jgi:hypothetical protein